MNGLGCVVYDQCLLGAYYTECSQQFVVYCTANSQKSPNNIVDTLDALSVNPGRCIFLVGMLDLAAVFYFPTSVGGQLAPFWCGVAKGNEKARDVFFMDWWQGLSA